MEPQESEKYSGLRQDLESLLNRFLQTQNVRFQMFAEEWRKLNFSFIHYGIEKGQEKREAMQEAFRIITDYFLPPYDLQRRVGAMYILYSLYMTQPHVPKFKIRMSVDQWPSVTKLIESLETQGHLDAIYVFSKLMTSKAFLFTARPKKMMFHASYMEGKSDQNPTERWLDRHRHSLMTECFDDATLEEHHELHEQYQKMKVNLGLHDNTSLMVVRESITEYIVKRFEKLERDFEANREQNQTTDTSDQDAEGRASRISQIKARSYSTMAKPSRSRRHMQQSAESCTNQKHSPAKSKVAKGKACRGRKVAAVPSSDAEIAEPGDASDDEMWTPRGTKKCKPQRRKKASASLGRKTQKAKAKQRRTAPADEPSRAPATPEMEAAGMNSSERQPEAFSTMEQPAINTHRKTRNIHDVQTDRSTRECVKRGRSVADSSTGQEGEDVCPVSPKKKLRGSKTTEHITEERAFEDDPSKTSEKIQRIVDETKKGSTTPLKKGPSTEMTPGTSPEQGDIENIGAVLRKSAGRDSSSARRGRDSSGEVSEQECASTSRELRSPSRRGKVSPRTAGTRDLGTPPTDERQGLPQGQKTTGRRNTTVRTRGGGLRARTRGARQNVKK